ncbi:MAG: sugar phosphate isomerase/epimerase, partial [Clostridia bacterium]|nr:sugar phosphate isomerase/epimerase [Clostridia bacterium]
RLGYEGIDMGFDYWVFDGSPFLKDDYLEWARSLKARADKAGIPYTHAHAPGEANSGDVIYRSIEAASVLGAKYLVIHPIWKDENGKIIESRSKFISVNAEAIKKLLPKAEKCGVILLSENILWGASKDPRIIAELVKEVNSDYFGWCFDTGHAHCSGYKMSVLEKCAVVPLSLHIQDNDGTGDGHLIPGDGTVNWDEFIAVLKKIGYCGDCVMVEAHHQSLTASDAQRDEILTRLLEEAEKLRDRMP